MKKFTNKGFLLTTFIGILLSSPIFGEEVHILMKDEIFKKLKSNLNSETSHSLSLNKAKQTKAGMAFLLHTDGLPTLSNELHKVLNRCGGFRSFYSKEERDRFISKSIEKSEVSSSLKRRVSKRKSLLNLDNQEIQLTKSDDVLNWFGQIERPRMNWMIDKLASYRTRYYTSPEGIEAMNWIYGQWQEITQGRSDVTLTKFTHANFQQPSIILTFKGSSNADETLVFGGHGDSINTDDGPNAVAPGADDNAAGVALLTEMIQLIVQNSFAPKRNITFMVYAAEEVGILGSYEITRHYRQNNINVVGAMQFDGVNYQGKTFEMALIADLTNQAQNEMLGALIDQYIQVPWTYQRCNFACSDHAAWNYEGYPVSYPVETTADEQNPHFHTKRDTFDKSNYDTIHAEKFLKLAISFLLERDAK